MANGEYAYSMLRTYLRQPIARTVSARPEYPAVLWTLGETEGSRANRKEPNYFLFFEQYDSELIRNGDFRRPAVPEFQYE